MYQEIIELVKNDAESLIEYDKYSDILEKNIKMELGYLSDGKSIKIVDFIGGKSDGLYLANPEDCEIYIVKDSFKISKIISKTEFMKLLGYSSLVRILSYNNDSPFCAIRYFTKEINKIVDIYK